MELKINLNKKTFSILVVFASIFFFSFVLAEILEPSHVAENILVDIPSDADCNYANSPIDLQTAVSNEERCLMVDGYEGIDYPDREACRLCKNNCGSYWNVEEGMFRTYGGTPESADSNMFSGNNVAKYKYFESGCTGSYSSLTNTGWGVRLKICCLA